MLEVSGLAPAKINLLLEVGGQRGDGYHEVETILQTLDLYDEVRLSLDRGAPAVSIEVDGPFADGTPVDNTNLCARAVEAFAQQAGWASGGVHIRLTKRIPAAAGLGGGASDAATTLRLLQALAAPGTPEPALMRAAAALGSDVPFFLVGGVALAAGRGERVTPLPDLPPASVVLFVPHDRQSSGNKTGRAFGALDAKTTPRILGIAAAITGREWTDPYASQDVYNAFEEVAFDIYPGLHSLWDQIERASDEAIRLAGAGPTLFWIGPEEGVARVRAAGVGLPCTTIVTRTAPAQWKQ